MRVTNNRISHFKKTELKRGTSLIRKNIHAKCPENETRKKKKFKRKFIYLALLRKRFALFNSAQEIGEAEAESWQLPISLTCLHNQLSSLRSTDAHKVLQMFKQGNLCNDQKYDVCIFAANFTEK